MQGNADSILADMKSSNSCGSNKREVEVRDHIQSNARNRGKATEEVAARVKILAIYSSTGGQSLPFPSLPNF